MQARQANNVIYNSKLIYLISPQGEEEEIMGNITEANYKAKTLYPSSAKNVEPLFDRVRQIYCSKTCNYSKQSRKVTRHLLHGCFINA